MKLRDYVGLTHSHHDQLVALVSNHRTLEQALHHWLGQSPPVDVANVIAQDEYTHDVIMSLPDGLALVYEST